ncbi:hypothetical protein [Nocardioides sp. LHG3406-4]|uniref:hypothetical protein n=1 Tax=Nocardioides sp. LHG3406-4 TaxID=2804575 RepID=UPI003CE70802
MGRRRHVCEPAEEAISAADASRRVEEDPDQQVNFPEQPHPSGTDASGPEDL